MRFVPFGLGIACVAFLLVNYIVSTPPLLFQWEAGEIRPTAASGWYALPQWISAAVVAAACGCTFASAVRLGASPLWAASAALSCGLGWMAWMVAAVPSAKGLALLLVGAGTFTVAWWSAGRPPDARARRVSLLLVALSLFVAGAWAQPLLPASGAVRMSASVGDSVRALAAELRLLSIIVAIVGLLELWTRARRAALALGLVVAAYLALPAIVGIVPDAAILAGSLPLWAIASFGFHWIARTGPRRYGAALALILALLIPGERWLLHHTFIQRAALPFFPGSLALSLAAMPSDGTLLSDGPASDRRIGRTAAVLPVGPFRLAHSGALAADPGAANLFALRGLRDETMAAAAFHTVPRRAPLSAFLHMLPPDNIVALALTPVAASTLSRRQPDYFSGIGAPTTNAAPMACALVGRVQAASGAHVQQDRELARVALANGTPWGEPSIPSPVNIEAVADRNVAAVAVDGREIVRVPHGGALLVLSREGHLQMASVITAEQQLSMPLPADDWSLGRLVGSTANGTPLPDPFFVHPLEASALVRFNGRDAAYFSSGWHAPEQEGPIDYMWTSDSMARLKVPLPQPLDLRVFVEVRPGLADERDPPMVALHVNDVALERQAAGPGRRMHEWRVPSMAWRAGVNDVAIELTKLTRPSAAHDSRLLGAAVSLFRLERVRQ